MSDCPKVITPGPVSHSIPVHDVTYSTVNSVEDQGHYPDILHPDIDVAPPSSIHPDLSPPEDVFIGLTLPDDNPLDITEPVTAVLNGDSLGTVIPGSST